MIPQNVKGWFLLSILFLFIIDDVFHTILFGERGVVERIMIYLLFHPVIDLHQRVLILEEANSV